MAKKAELEERRLLEHILINVQYVNLAVGLRSIAWSLRQIAVYSGMIGEITINTAITEPSDLIRFEKTKETLWYDKATSYNLYVDEKLQVIEFCSCDIISFIYYYYS